MRNEESPWTWNPVRPDVDVEVTTEAEPLRRLDPGRICPNQQGDLTDITIKTLPG